MNDVDRRKTPRTLLNLPLRLEIPNPPQNIPHVISGESFDISKGGVGINIKNLILPPGLSGILNIDMPDSTLKIECKVVWSNSSKTGESRCGMYFAKLENGHVSILNKITTDIPPKKRKFAFITNLRDASDWPRVMYTSKFIPEDRTLTEIKENPGYVIWSHFDVYNKIEGYFIVLLLTGKEIVETSPHFARRKVLETALFAQNKLGTEYIGLGSYVPSITNKGQWLAAQEEIKAYLTHGDSLTSWTAIEGIRNKTGIDLAEAKIAIVGATGLIGNAISRVLVKHCKKLIMIGRNPNKLIKLENLIRGENKDLKTQTLVTDRIQHIKEADIIVSATSSPDTVIKEEYIKPGAIIYDLAQPLDITPETCCNRPDITKIDGSFVKIPGINLGINIGTPPGTAFACLGDIILQCLEDTQKNRVGPIELSWIKEIDKYANKYGFYHADPSCFSWPIPERCFSPQRNAAAIYK